MIKLVAVFLALVALSRLPAGARGLFFGLGGSSRSPYKTDDIPHGDTHSSKVATKYDAASFGNLGANVLGNFGAGLKTKGVAKASGSYSDEDGDNGYPSNDNARLHNAPSHYAPRRYAPANYAPSRYAPPRYAPANYAPDNYAPPRYAPANYAPSYYAPVRYAQGSYAPSYDYPDRRPRGYSAPAWRRPASRQGYRMYRM